MDYCIGCMTEIYCIDDAPNGDHNATCAKCRAEEEHDFDAEPDVTFTRCGWRVEAPPTEAV